MSGARRPVWRRAARRLRKSFGRQAVILLYHRVTDLQLDPWSMAVTPEHFSEHLQILARYRPLRLLDLAAAADLRELPKRSVAITFDDGYADNLHEARPLLAHYRVPATVFLVAGAIGSHRELWWDELERILLTAGKLPDTLRLSLGETSFSYDLGNAAAYGEETARSDCRWRIGQPPPGPRQILYRKLWERLRPLPASDREQALERLRSWARTEPAARSSHRVLNGGEVAELANDRLIDIGVHTMTHPALSSLQIADQRVEVEQAKKILEGMVGPRSVDCFSYPFGDYSTDTAALVRESGFRAACSNVAAPVRRSSNRYELPRVHVYDWDGPTFAERLSRWL